MSTATLNVWITNMGDPCSIANDSGSGIPSRWSVAVSHCSGRVVNWSEGRYRHHRDDKWTPISYHTPSGGTPGWWYEMIPTRDGHVEIELPPGCYVVRGTMHSWFVHGLLYGNWATERAITQVSCGQDACVTLYAPSAPACSIPLFQFVIPLLVQRQIIGREEGERAIEALKTVFRPDAASAFEREEFETLRRAFEGMESENRRKKEGKS
jgi:hypothetical protein